ncbi:Bifunctional inhibitor/lipid-transfer protein/seed storage 2S albumin superfamily protein [Euphorbia peplus]|nr:Bifunctional inhibitor/lipid-transfer protein/seed storage 2S albumin superfamily protein [Euphorbia peplus]
MASSSTIPACIFVLSLLLFSNFSSAMPKPTDIPPTPGPIPSIPSPATPSLAPAPARESCPVDTLKLGVCADLLGLVSIVIGSPPSGSKCCAVIEGLLDLEAALCLCTAIKANVLGINLNVPVTLGLLVSACEKTLPEGFTCPP